MRRKIILASTSPNRSGLLEQLGLEFEIIPSAYEEDMSLRMNPKKMVMKFAEGKADDVAENTPVKGIVIGVDTLAVCRGEKLGKPGTRENAIRMLKKISGRTVKVYSGICIIDIDVNEKKKVVDYEVSKVKMKKLSDEEIEAYVNTGEPLDKAGAFAIQGIGAVFVEKIKGCYSNVIGLPLHNIYKNLLERGTNILEYERLKEEGSEDSQTNLVSPD
jgi:septum formation protein